jgi:hypothetical protein
VTVSSGNQNFKNSLLICKGMAKDGLASAAGTPRLFIWLNNSKMVGIQKVAAPLFYYLARRANGPGKDEAPR